MIERKCEICNKKFVVFPSKIKYGWGRFCSVACKRKWMSKKDRFCSVCGIKLDEKTLYKKGRLLCKSCGKKKEREWNIKRYWNNKKYYLEKAKFYYQKNRTDILEKKRKKYEKEIERFLEIKKKVFEEYGGKCECCGEEKMEFLTIDHIGGGGRKEKNHTGSGKMLYKWLFENGCPKERYRLLCMNCNFSIGMWGYCPHNKKTKGLNIQSV